MAVTIKVDSQEVRSLFARLSALVANPRAALVEIGNRILGVAREAFEKETAPEGLRGEAFGQQWVGLSPNYAVWKARHFRGRHILRRSNALINSLFSEVREEGVVVGSPMPYASVHQEGFSGSVQVSEHTRRLSVEQRKKKFRFGPLGKKGPAIRVGSTFAGGVPVRAHLREMKIPPRPYLPGAALAEKIAVETLEEHIIQAMRAEPDRPLSKRAP